MSRPPDLVLRAALDFLRDEAGFAQVTTLDRQGFPVARTMTAFIRDDWSVDLVQRGTHARVAQWRSNPRTLIAWIGAPASDASNDSPHVFDLGLLPPRAVFVRGTAAVMEDEWTVECYQRELAAQRAVGHTRAPVRDRGRIVADLVGVHLTPVRIRLEGFGSGANSFDWTVHRGET